MSPASPTCADAPLEFLVKPIDLSLSIQPQGTVS